MEEFKQKVKEFWKEYYWIIAIIVVCVFLGLYLRSMIIDSTPEIKVWLSIKLKDATMESLMVLGMVLIIFNRLISK